MVSMKVNEHSQFDEMGIITIWGAIESSIALAVCEKIISFNSQNRLDFIQILINSPGGSCSDGLAIVDLMAWSKIPIRTIGIGLVASMGLAVFVAGEKGHRVITPNTSVMAHRFHGIRGGNHAELMASRKEEDYLHERIVTHYTRYSRLTSPQDVTTRILREVDTWLKPSEAVDLGLADIVLENTGDLLRKQEV